MANLTNYAQKKLLDKTLGLADYAAPTAYLAAFTASPGENGSLSAEVSGGNYARVEITSKMGATALSTGIATNTSAITFPVASAGWGTVTYLGICDASSGGNALIYFPLSEAKVVNASDPALEFVPGTITIFALLNSPSDLTQYLAKKWLDHLLGTASFTMPTAVYLGLFSADPTSSGSLSNEIASGGYGRQAITSLMEETVLTTGIAVNDDAVAFPTPTADYDVTHYGVMDAVSAGNMLLRKARTATLNVTSGGAFVQVPPGQLILRAA